MVQTYLASVAIVARSKCSKKMKLCYTSPFPLGKCSKNFALSTCCYTATVATLSHQKACSAVRVFACRCTVPCYSCYTLERYIVSCHSCHKKKKMLDSCDNCDNSWLKVITEPPGTLIYRCDNSVTTVTTARRAKRHV